MEEDRNTISYHKPKLKPKTTANNPFYVLQAYRKNMAQNTYKTIQPTEIRQKSFPKRITKSKPRSKTLPDTSLNVEINLPPLTPKVWQPKKPHVYFNLNHLIKENRKYSNIK